MQRLHKNLGIIKFGGWSFRPSAPKKSEALGKHLHRSLYSLETMVRLETAGKSSRCCERGMGCCHNNEICADWRRTMLQTGKVGKLTFLYIRLPSTTGFFGTNIVDFITRSEISDGYGSMHRSPCFSRWCYCKQWDMSCFVKRLVVCKCPNYF